MIPQISVDVAYLIGTVVRKMSSQVLAPLDVLLAMNFLLCYWYSFHGLSLRSRSGPPFVCLEGGPIDAVVKTYDGAISGRPHALLARAWSFCFGYLWSRD